MKSHTVTRYVFSRPPVLYARLDDRRSTTPGRPTGSIPDERPPMRTVFRALAFFLVAWFVAAVAFSSNASAQETTVTFDATMAGPTTAATTMTPTTTSSTTPESQPTSSQPGSTDASTYTSTTVYPTQEPGTSPSTTGGGTIAPSTTASTVFQPAATAPVNSTTPYAGTTSVGYPSMPGGQLMSTGGFGLRSVLIGTALSLIAGGSMLYAAYKARRRAGGNS